MCEQALVAMRPCQPDRIAIVAGRGVIVVAVAGQLREAVQAADQRPVVLAPARFVDDLLVDCPRFVGSLFAPVAGGAVQFRPGI